MLPSSSPNPLPKVLVVEIGNELGEYAKYIQSSVVGKQYLPPVMTVLTSIIDILRWPEYSDMALSNYVQDIVGINSDISKELGMDDMKLFTDALETATRFIISAITSKLREYGCFNHETFPYELYSYNETCLILTLTEED